MHAEVVRVPLVFCLSLCVLGKYGVCRTLLGTGTLKLTNIPINIPTGWYNMYNLSNFIVIVIFYFLHSVLASQE